MRSIAYLLLFTLVLTSVHSCTEHDEADPYTLSTGGELEDPAEPDREDGN